MTVNVMNNKAYFLSDSLVAISEYVPLGSKMAHYMMVWRGHLAHCMFEVATSLPSLEVKNWSHKAGRKSEQPVSSQIYQYTGYCY